MPDCHKTAISENILTSIALDSLKRMMSRQRIALTATGPILQSRFALFNDGTRGIKFSSGNQDNMRMLHVQHSWPSINGTEFTTEGYSLPH